MKNFIKNTIVGILSFESKRTLEKHKPKVIGITGNVGKTTTKDYVNNFLKFKYKNKVRASEKSQNSEWGVNLTILGEKNAWNNVFVWTKIIIKNYLKIYFNKVYPKILVLEVGADKPGDIKFITEIVRPNMVVLTAFQKSPTHGEFFLNIDQHILEKKYLVDAILPNGTIVYNCDDEVMSQIAQGKYAEDKNLKLFSFGFSETANVRIVESTNLYSDDAKILGTLAKFDVKILDKSFVLNLRILGVLGTAHLYSLASAICVGVLEGLSEGDLQESVKEFDWTKSRMRILDGKNNAIIIDDSYNSSPLAAFNAIETVSKVLSKGKKIAILGHMAELGSKTKVEHFNIGMLASKVFDAIILSGRYNEYFLEGIRENKFDLNKVYLANDPKEVIELLNEKQIVKDWDLVLIKGSQSARLEKVVVDLLKNPEDKDSVCRQDVEWEKR